MALDEAQSLMVNRMAAVFATQYTAVFVLQQQVLHMGTVFSPDSPTTRSRQITRSTLQPYL